MSNRIWIIAASFVALVGCQGSEGGSAKPAGSAAAATPPAAAAPEAAKDGMVDVDLSPLDVKIKVAAGGKGTMDKSRDGKKLVMVDVGGDAGINVEETTEDLAAIKKKFEEDKTLYPFKKWEKEEASLAVLQFEVDGKAGYIGVSLKDVGGKKYRCQTTGMDGVASVDLAVKQLSACDSLSAK